MIDIKQPLELSVHGWVHAYLACETAKFVNPEHNALLPKLSLRIQNSVGSDCILQAEESTKVYTRVLVSPTEAELLGVIFNKLRGMGNDMPWAVAAYEESFSRVATFQNDSAQVH